MFCSQKSSTAERVSPTFLSGAGPALDPDVSRAPGSVLGNNRHADPRYEAGPGASCCSLGTGWATSLGTGVFSYQKDSSASLLTPPPPTKAPECGIS